ncbi:MAG: hypothetical protein OJF51_002461 [Nitrospira sp.]|jgi:hypothetical protein|nr:MAG: hypothetical protein OJF51_002461 [Nitrospira sp.]
MMDGANAQWRETPQSEMSQPVQDATAQTVETKVKVEV